ncbi:MAG: hypothetical protein WAU01_13690, partial [Saprospiraceae bacterium]
MKKFTLGRFKDYKLFLFVCIFPMSCQEDRFYELDYPLEKSRLVVTGNLISDKQVSIYITKSIENFKDNNTPDALVVRD